MASLISSIKEVVWRANFISALAMFFCLAMMVVQDDIAIRAFLLLPVIFFYYLSKILFAKEQQDRVDRIIENIKAREK